MYNSDVTKLLLHIII